MPPAGRPRKHNPTIPAHIDQARLPRGLYWNPLGRWYVREGKAKRYVAGKDAKLSDLHAIMEGRTAPDRSLAALCAAYAESEQWAALLPNTRKDYAYCASVLCAVRLKDGSTLGKADTRTLSRPLLQRVVDAIAKGTDKPTPSKAAHVARYLGVVMGWGANRGHCPAGIAGKFDLPKERRNARMPEAAQHDALVAFAREHGRVAGVKDAVAPYLWAVAEIAYLCRLRGVEVCDMTEASATADGLLCLRRKGSEPNVVLWSPRLRAAWDFLLADRDARWKRLRRPVPLRADARPLVVARDGEPLARRALTVAWGRLSRLAVARGILSADQRFGLHGLKHRGITDTAGTRGEKRQASGHKTEAMVARYDHEVPRVQAAGAGKIPRQTP